MRNAPGALAPATALLLTLLAFGCTGALPQRYPSRPPAGMAASQADQDERACVNAAARATTERAWAYIGCMVSKGHTVGVAFHVQGETYMGVAQTRPHEAPVAAAEVESCRRSAYAAGRAGGGSTREAVLDRMEGAFRTCLDPLGYTVQRAGAPAPGRPGS